MGGAPHLDTRDVWIVPKSGDTFLPHAPVTQPLDSQMPLPHASSVCSKKGVPREPGKKKMQAQGRLGSRDTGRRRRTPGEARADKGPSTKSRLLMRLKRSRSTRSRRSRSKPLEEIEIESPRRDRIPSTTTASLASGALEPAANVTFGRGTCTVAPRRSSRWRRRIPTLDGFSFGPSRACAFDAAR